MASSKSTVLITGCSDGGIGSALAAVFQQRGYHVFATARDPSKLSSLKDLPNVTLLKLEVTSAADIHAAAEAVSKQTGGTLDYLISNAGRNHFTPILDDDVAKAREIFDINIFGPMVLAQTFAPLLMRAKGMLAFITSIAGYMNTPYMGA